MNATRLLALLIVALLLSNCTAYHNRKWSHQIYGKQRTKIKKAAGSIDYHSKKPRAK